MKFGKEYETQMIQEWREAYMDYRSLKAIVKQILRHHLQKQQRPPPHPPPHNGQTAPLQSDNAVGQGGEGTGQTGLSRTISLYRAFSGLTNRARGSPKKSHKPNNPLSSKRHHHYHLFDDDDEQVILINEDKSGSYTTTFLCSAEEGGEMDVQFFRRLDGEFNKVLRFYKQKVESVMEEADELSRQLNVLIALRVKVENPNVVFPHISAVSSAQSSPHATPRASATSPMDVIKEVEQNEDKKVYKPAPIEMLDHIKIKIESETPLQTLKCMIMGLTSEQTFSKVELKRAEELMSRAFVEFYQKLSFLNQLAFSKILKKYDKTTSRNTSKPYLNTVDHSYLGSCDEVSRLMSRVEATFIKHFANGNHRDGMKSLRPKTKREKHRVTYCLGFLSGCAAALAISIAVVVHIRGIAKSEGRHQYMENIFPLYSLLGFVAVHLFMFAGDIYFWSRYRVNYPFIFGFEHGNDLGYREVLLIGAGLAVLTFGGVLSNLDMEMDPRTKSFSVVTELVPLALLFCLLTVAFCPFDIIYRSSRYFFIGCVVRCVLSPLYKVILPDFFLADQLTSQVVNVVLRLAWMQTVLGIKEAPFLHKRALVAVVAILEIVRRGIWNFFRLENEHLNNVGKYRAFKSVPLPFQEVGGNKSM
ncbi:hypothetical protein Bca4012_067263 [Brassica carinata]